MANKKQLNGIIAEQTKTIISLTEQLSGADNKDEITEKEKKELKEIIKENEVVIAEAKTKIDAIKKGIIGEDNIEEDVAKMTSERRKEISKNLKNIMGGN